MKIQMTDLRVGYPQIKEEVEKAIMAVLKKTNFILGEEVEKFEKEFAEFCGSKYAIGVASGTDALKIALLASGIGEGDEVITSPSTFIATTEAIVQSKATPVFADILPDTYTLNPEEVKRKITPRTRAILPVHLYGHPADMDAICDIAVRHNLKIIEDCAQAFTAQYRTSSDGKWHYTGTLGIAGCFSFFPAKNLGAFGDGGMIITDSEEVYNKARALRNHGSFVRYYHEMDGFNSRLDTIQAAVLSVKLKYISRWTAMRNEVAARYKSMLGKDIFVPVVKENCRHSFNYYNLRFKNKTIRDRVQKSLTDNGVASQIYYPVPLHLQDVYKYLGYKKGDFPVSEMVSDETLALPMYPELNDEEVTFICNIIMSSAG